MVYINTNDPAQLDVALIPNAIYNSVINYDRKAVQIYIEENPALIWQFIAFNGSLKLASSAYVQRKVSGYYRVPWVTYYQVQNGTDNVVLSQAQQALLFQYMLNHWGGINGLSISYLQFILSVIQTFVQRIYINRAYIQQGKPICLNNISLTKTINNSDDFLEFCRTIFYYSK